MTVTELNEAAARASERFEAIRDRGHAALRSVADARNALAEANAAQQGAAAALEALADRHLAETPASDKAVSSALATIDAADRQVRWLEAVVAAGQRALQAAQVSLAEAEADRMATAETSRRAGLRARVLELAHS